ncbi:MAG TPA: formate dehydrogenase accessory sulfurtransferase FdhD, partial [Elainellaceae cyanobacterium]
GDQRYNIVNVTLNDASNLDLRSLERHFFTTSACGVCGKASLEALQIRGCARLSDQHTIKPETLYRLPEELRAAQGLFSSTGGLHAAALFDLDGHLLRVREDVGRHNALDKLIGAALIADELPLSQHIVMVSGRSSFELAQKCLMARVPILCAVSAPSSLAVTVAQEFGMTLIGFLREQRFNVYAGVERLK